MYTYTTRPKRKSTALSSHLSNARRSTPPIITKICPDFIPTTPKLMYHSILRRVTHHLHICAVEAAKIAEIKLFQRDIILDLPVVILLHYQVNTVSISPSRRKHLKRRWSKGDRGSVRE